MIMFNKYYVYLHDVTISITRDTILKQRYYKVSSQGTNNKMQRQDNQPEDNRYH